MRWRLALIVAVLAIGSIGAGVGASTHRAVRPNVVCNLPGQVQCVTDPECAAFNAFCDTTTMFCVCASTDMDAGTDSGFGELDLGGGDFATPAPGNVVNTGAPPAVGGGMTAPSRSGCSFVPGTAW